MVGASQEELTFEWNGIQLAGTLHLPAGEPPHSER